MLLSVVCDLYSIIRKILRSKVDIFNDTWTFPVRRSTMKKYLLFYCALNAGPAANAAPLFDLERLFALRRTI